MQDFTLRGNFRDLATYNDLIRPGLIFRSESLTLMIENEFFNLVRNNHIRSVLDLRSNDEVSMDPYENYMLEYINYFHVPIDPTQQHANFDPAFVIRGMEDIYRFFAEHCKKQVLQVFDILVRVAEQGVVIHCYAGRDRTGFIASLIHLLTGAPYEVVIKDFTASSPDAKPEFMDVVYREIEQQKGIRQYLLNCGINEKKLDTLLSLIKK